MILLACNCLYNYMWKNMFTLSAVIILMTIQALTTSRFTQTRAEGESLDIWYNSEYCILYSTRKSVNVYANQPYRLIHANDFFNFCFFLYYSQIRCSVPPNIATLPLILQCSCANCSEQVAPELASCNCINFNKFVDFNIFVADFRW